MVSSACERGRSGPKDGKEEEGGKAKRRRRRRRRKACIPSAARAIVRISMLPPLHIGIVGQGRFPATKTRDEVEGQGQSQVNNSTFAPTTRMSLLPPPSPPPSLPSPSCLLHPLPKIQHNESACRPPIGAGRSSNPWHLTQQKHCWDCWHPKGPSAPWTAATTQTSLKFLPWGDLI